MHCLRRSAARRLLSKPSILPRGVQITRTPSQAGAAAFPPLSSVYTHTQRYIFQRRWVSDDVSNRSEKETPALVEDQEEARVVENATESTATTSTLAEADASTVDAGVQGESEQKTTASTTPEAANEEAGEGQTNYKFSMLPEPKDTIYIGNLFYDVTSDDLRRAMEKFGVVQHASIAHDPRGISRGFGYVAFDGVEAAQRAVDEMNLQIYEGRRIIVQFARDSASERGPENPVTRTLFVANLHFGLTDRDLNELFRDVPNVIDVRVSVDRRNGQFRGFVHAEFLDKRSAQIGREILQLRTPYGRKLKIEYSRTEKGTRIRQTGQEW
ncbi:hypothetical protein ASPZODRAFT_133089 [Penicilliopsis zonata CBS 506.65]|uniref:RRM domain-containing protein n=1 Tax=Penicilliopsis zonata CBS 506.65 TaxID=1073090 RepID=A0A1L9SFT5_9EURO|nr:hypothetical protein ASPZODRAFT_133089 [Penicilliopsis zonata CBS 506.65]OJJ46100.1 hypothetical protein ASPZODRAFT_133089 [Penicilliopsis zonata CBS 506.65]